MAQSKTILIVEDEANVRTPLALQLTERGYAVLEAENGKQGLQITLKRHPDLILLDVLMPVMDGMTMLKRLRQDIWGRDAKVIILTNNDDLRQMADALGERAFDYLVKVNWTIASVIVKIQQRLAE